MKTLIVALCLLTSLAWGGNKPPLHLSEPGKESTPLLTARNYTYTLNESEKGVRLKLEPAEAKKLTEISRHYLGKKLSFSLGEKEVSSPTLKDVIGEAGVWLTLPDLESFEAMKKALGGN